ncbi:MAG: SRPBCC family protein [Cyanobacteria bacterium J06639_1]
MARIYENSIEIAASVESCDRCLTEPELMHRWLNPMLRCEAVGEWSVEVGDRFRFVVTVPVVDLSLDCAVRERAPGLVVWEFAGFFVGSDRWDCQFQADNQTRLLNRFEFEIPNLFVRVGFDLVAARLTQQDMRSQLQRFKQVAEEISDRPRLD